MVPRKTTTRQRLITTAADLFRRQGYAQTGVNQIIQEAKATSGSFYHFFAAKEDLLLAVVDHVAEVFETEILDAAADQSDNAIERIFNILDLYRQKLLEDGFTFASPLAGLSAEVSESHPAVRDRLAEIFAGWTEHIEGLLRDASSRLQPSADTAALSQLVVCTMEGAVLGTRLNRSVAPFDAAITQLRTYFDLLIDRTEMPVANVVARPAAGVTSSQTADWRSW